MLTEGNRKVSHVFISYARDDLQIADKLVERLESARHRVWIDREEIRGGEQWRQQIVSAIRSCDAFLVLLSHKSVLSKHVRKELDIADNADRLIVPVQVEHVDVPEGMEYQLAGLHVIDCVSDFERGMLRILEGLERMRAPPVAVSSGQASSIDENDTKFLALMAKVAGLDEQREKLLDQLVGMDQEEAAGVPKEQKADLNEKRKAVFTDLELLNKTRDSVIGKVNSNLKVAKGQIKKVFE